MPYKISKLSNNKPLVSLATLVLLLFFAALLFIIEPATEEKLEKRTPLAVKVTGVKYKTFMPTATYTGRLKPFMSAQLKFEISGRLKKKMVEPGAFVKSGEVLLVLDEYDLYKKLFNIAHENLELQKREVDRVEELGKESLLSKSQLDNTKQKLLEIASTVHKAKRDLERTQLKSRFEGYVNEVFVEAGDTVSPNEVVATLVDTTKLDLYLEVRGDVIDNLRLGQEIPIDINGSFEKGTLIAYQTDPDIKTFTHAVRVRVTSEDARSGMLATAILPLKKLTEVLTIPVTSVLTDEGKKYVFLVDESQRLLKKEIQTGTRYENIIVVLSGLSAGDTIISKDVAALSADQEVIPVDTK